jgi:hypothetical protein
MQVQRGIGQRSSGFHGRHKVQQTSMHWRACSRSILDVAQNVLEQEVVQVEIWAKTILVEAQCLLEHPSQCCAWRSSTRRACCLVRYIECCDYEKKCQKFIIFLNLARKSKKSIDGKSLRPRRALNNLRARRPRRALIRARRALNIRGVALAPEANFEEAAAVRADLLIDARPKVYDIPGDFAASRQITARAVR